MSLNSSGATAARAGSTSSGTAGSGSGFTISLNLGGQETNSTPGTTAPGTTAPGAPPFPTNPSPAPLSGSGLATEAAASTNLITLSSPMVPPATGLPPQAGL